MKNRNSLNLSKSLPGKLLLTLALIIGGGNLNFAWGVVDNGDGTLTEDFTNYSRAYSSSSGDYSITTPDGWYAYPSSVSYFIYSNL